MNNQGNLPLTSFHWGSYRVETQDGKLAALHPFEQDPDPSPIAEGYLGVLDGPERITAPMVRKSWAEGGAGTNGERRGKEEFITINWDEGEQLVAPE